MDIAALSTVMNSASLKGDVGYAIMGKAMEQLEQEGEGMQKILESSVAPYLGQNVDYSV